MKKTVIIVAGGEGTRMKSEVPKQFITVAGKPVLMHTIEKFYFFSNTIKIILVLPQSGFNLWRSLCEKYSFNIMLYLVKGGKTRFDSVKNGLELVEHDSLVAVHDGVRPLININTIKKIFDTAEKYGNAVPAVAVSESLRQIKDKLNVQVSRDQYYLVQTPQCFKSNLILKAYNQEYNSLFTDDASVIESTGIKVHLVEGNRENIKITHQEDLKVAEALLK